MEDAAVQSTETKQLLRAADVATIIGVSRRSLTNFLADDPSFPRPVRIGGRSTGWRRAELQKWIDERPLARMTPEAA